MTLFGVDPWTRRGEAFGVYFNLFSRISPITRRGDQLGLRRPLSGLSDVGSLPGTVALLAVMIGSVTFDGAAEAPLWTGIAPDISKWFRRLGLTQETALEATFMVGLVAAILIVFGFYRLGIAGTQTVGGSLSTDELARAFVPSLVPIAFAYVAAPLRHAAPLPGPGDHRAVLQPVRLPASNPLGDSGTDLFGTAG